MIRCLFGYHDWLLTCEEDIPNTWKFGPVVGDHGGVDYHITCRRCGVLKVEKFRGVWTTPDYAREP